MKKVKLNKREQKGAQSIYGSNRNYLYKAFHKKTKKDYQSLQDLEGRVFAILFIIIGLCFLSSSITGYVIGGLNNATLSLTGFLFFLIGILGLFVYFRRKS